MKEFKKVIALFVTMAVLFLSMGCTGIDENSGETPDGDNNQTVIDPLDKGFVPEGFDVPADVLAAAKTQVEQLFDISRADYPDYGYTNWRIENLAYSYTYDNLNDMQLVVYQMNYEFLTESPEKIGLAGGMYITEDNWVMPGYPNSTYLIFRQDGDKQVFLHFIVENDCTPGTELFTEDLLRILT